MKKYKNDIKTIIEVLAFIMLWLGFSFLQNPVVSYAGAIVLFAVWTLNIIDKLKYRNNKIPNELRFPTGNEDYSKFTSLTLGLCFFGGSIGFAVWTSDPPYLLMFTGLGGVLVFISGLLDTPKGIISIANNRISASGIDVKLNTETIQAIEISSEKIIERSPNWLNNMSVFKNKPLSQILKGLERKYDVAIEDKSGSEKRMLTEEIDANEKLEDVEGLRLPFAL